ncbi:hypothetical protein N2152v2_001667 [Parachlorella kessleri]
MAAATAGPSRGLLWVTGDLVITDFFDYSPSLALAAIALSLYTLAALVIGYQTHRSKRKYLHTMAFTGLLEAGGYAALIAAIKLSGKSDIYGAYVTMQVLVVLSPNLIQATDYITASIGSLLASSPEITKGRRLLSRAGITAIFAGSDLLALIIQAIGISIWATARSSEDGSSHDVKLGGTIIVVGLGLQLISFLIFILVAVWVRRHPKNAIAGTRELRKLFVGLYINVAFLSIRNIYRFAEFLQSVILAYPVPEDAYVLSDKEVLFYTLDTIPILICFASFILYHPGWYLPALPPKQAKQPKQSKRQQGQQQFLAGTEANGNGRVHVSKELETVDLA